MAVPMSSHDPHEDNIRSFRREEPPVEKLLPQNVGAETALLGAMLESDSVSERAAAQLAAQDFYRDAHREIYRACLAVLASGAKVNYLTVCDELSRAGRLEEVGGESFVTSLTNQIPPNFNAADCIGIVARTATMRRLISTAGQIAAIAYSEPDASVALAEADRLLGDVHEKTRGGERRFGILSDLELEQTRPSKGILGSWVRDQEIVAIYGAAESYKSFLAIAMGECWATGMDWYGMPVEQRTVLYIAAEAPGTIGDRVAAWKQHHGIAGQRTEFYTATLPVDLTSHEEVVTLIHEIRECLPDAPGAVIIDTYACATSGDEKDAASVNAAYRGMRLLRDAFGATIVYVDHEGKDRERGQTGSQRKKDNADVQMHVELIEGSDGMLTVRPVKMKAEEKPTPLTLQTKRVSFFNSRTQEMRTSLVLISTGKAEARAASNEARAERLSRRQRQALDALTDLPDGRAAYGEWWRACHGGDAKNFPKRTFDDARTHLLKMRLVEVTEDVYASLVRNQNRTSAPAPLRTSAVGAGGIYTPAPHRTKEAELSGEEGKSVQAPPPEAGQTAPYHRHNLKTIRTLSSGISICDDCHPRPARGAPPPHSA